MLKIYSNLILLKLKKTLFYIQRAMKIISYEEFAKRRIKLKNEKKYLSIRRMKLQSLKHKEKHYWRGYNKNTNKVVYTCITGGYDVLLHHKYINKDWNYICFTDDKEMLALQRIGVWTIRDLQFNKLDNVRNARWHKINPHLILKEYKYSLWCDGSCSILDDYIFARIDKFIKEEEFLSISRHYQRSCIYEEIRICLEEQKDNFELINQQYNELVSACYPYKNGLHETFLIFRNHTNTTCVSIMNDWWHYVKNFSRRDQLSLDFVIWKHGISIKALGDIPLRDSPHILFYFTSGHCAPSIHIMN